MYWTDWVGGTIQWAEMDGRGPSVLISGLDSPHGITIEFDSSRLYWAERDSSEILSSDFQGKDIRTIVTLSGNAPVGIATLSSRV